MEYALAENHQFIASTVGKAFPKANTTIPQFVT